MMALATGQIGAGAPGLGGSVHISTLPAWTSITGIVAGTSNGQTLAITNPVTLSAAIVGGGSLGYLLNGTYYFYGGPFVVHPSDILVWSVVVGGASGAGTVTVTNTSDTGSPVIATINYSIRALGGVWL